MNSMQTIFSRWTFEEAQHLFFLLNTKWEEKDAFSLFATKDHFVWNSQATILPSNVCSYKKSLESSKEPLFWKKDILLAFWRQIMLLSFYLPACSNYAITTSDYATTPTILRYHLRGWQVLRWGLRREGGPNYPLPISSLKCLICTTSLAASC